MLVFSGLATLLTLFALVVLLPTLWRGPGADSPDVTDQHQVNLQIAKTQLSDLETHLTNSAVTQSEYEARKLEIERAFATTLVSTERDSLERGFVDSGSVDAGSVDSGSVDRGNKLRNSGNGIFISVLVCLLLPSVAAFGYWKLGTPKALDREYVEQQNALARGSGTKKLPAVDELLPKLEAHLADNPDDVKGWRLLGVSYLRLARYRESIDALEKALALEPANADIMFQLADATALAGGGQLQGEPEALIKRGLSIRPNDPRGHWMLGMLAHQQGNTELAVSRWENLIPLLKDQPTALAEVQQLIATSRSEMGSEKLSDMDDPASDKSAEVSAAADRTEIAGGVESVQLSVTVSISDEFKARLKPDHAVFIYAKAFNGPPMPLAVVRATVADLPFDATLTDAQAMIPAMSLSQFSEVIVGARVSFSGDPIAKSGDLFSEFGPVKIDQSSAVSLSISKVVP